MGSMMAALRTLAFAVLLCQAMLGWAQAPAKYYWYDGQVKRYLYFDEGVVAHFDAGPSTKATVLRQRALSAQDSFSSTSPVFREFSGGAERALPGGVIVSFPLGTTAEAALARLAAQGLNTARRIGAMDHVWFIASAPGVPALDLANRLYETGAFATAAPNWWQARRPQ
jgi:hypothetical protein